MEVWAEKGSSWKCKKDSKPCVSPGFSQLAGQLQLLSLKCIILNSPFMPTWSSSQSCSPPCRRTHVTLDQFPIIVSWVYTQWLCFQIRLQSEVAGLRTSTQAFGQEKSIQPLASQCGTNIVTKLFKYWCKPGVFSSMMPLFSVLQNYIQVLVHI